MADAFGDDASLAGTSARDDEQRAFPVSDGAVLRFIQLRPSLGSFRLAKFEQGFLCCRHLHPKNKAD